MRAISEVASQELAWMQPAARKREHELRAGDELVGTLRFQRGTLADAESDAHHWTFKRQGFWHPHVTVRAPGSDNDVAIFRPHWTGGGTLEFPDGRTMRLATANLWQTEWVWHDKDHPLIRFKGRHGVIKAKGAVDIEPEAVKLPDLPLLVLLGWYLILLYAQDTAVATTAVVPAVTA